MTEGFNGETFYIFWIVFIFAIILLFFFLKALKLMFVEFSGLLLFHGCFRLGSRMIIELWFTHQPSSTLDTSGPWCLLMFLVGFIF